MTTRLRTALVTLAIWAPAAIATALYIGDEVSAPTALALGLLSALLQLFSQVASNADTSAQLRALRDASAWRQLSQAQREALINDLRSRPITVEVDWARGPEPEKFAAEISAALRAAGCTVLSNGAVTEEGHYWGILGPGPGFDEDVSAQQLRAAFKAAGLDLRRVLDLTAVPRVLVGSKRPPEGQVPPEQPISSEDPARH